MERIINGVDHLASATEEFKERIPTLFSIPDVGFTIVNIPCIHYRRYCQRLIRSTHLLKLPPVRVKLIFIEALPRAYILYFAFPSIY